MSFKHNSTLAANEPDWGGVDKPALPDAAFADHGEPGKKSTRSYPHHWVQGGAKKDQDGIWTEGTMYLHKGGLDAAWSAANGGRSGKPASQAVKDHLEAHRKALGLDKPEPKSQGEARYPLMAADFFGKCWALTSEKMGEIQLLAEAIMDGKKLDFEAAAKRLAPEAEAPPYENRGGVAVIPVYGTLEKRANLLSNASGGTSYEKLVQAARQAGDDPNVEAALLDVDSPGGSVDGVKMAGDAILALRQKKPVVAFANGQMASGAYWLSSAADKIVAPETAHLGSIGVRMVHIDRSAKDAQQGIKRTAIYAGRYKNVGDDAQPLNPEDQAYLQDICDYYYGLFTQAVGAHRGLAPDSVHSLMGEGRIFIGQRAKDAGLADQIGSFEDAWTLAKTMAAARQIQSPAAHTKGGVKVDIATLKAEHPDLCAALSNEGIQAERARMVEIMEACGAKGSFLLELVAKGVEVKDALKQILANHEKAKTDTLAALQMAAPPVLGTDPLTVVKADAAAAAAVKATTLANAAQPLEERAKAAWDDAATGLALKNEYGGKFELYLTYLRKVESGQIRETSK